MDFLHVHPNFRSVTIKYSTPGHSALQEVDSVHSSIERVFAKSEFYFPLGVLKLLLKVNEKRSHRVIEMQKLDLKKLSSLCSHIKL